jgi:hypothetical protein
MFMTHVIVSHPHHDLASADFAAAVVAFCRAGDSATRVDERVYAPKGGPDAVYLAAFAAFNEPAFKRFVQDIPWQCPWGVTAFARRPGGSRFEHIDLEMELDIGRERKLAAGSGWGVAVAEQQAGFLAATYPALLERCRDLVLNSIRNPHRHVNSSAVLASFQTEVPWAFECLRVFPEHRYTTGRRHEFGPGKADWTMVHTKHRIVNVEMAVRGVYTRLMCDSADAGIDTFERVLAAVAPLRPGDPVLVDGAVDVRADGECFIEKVRHVAAASNVAGRDGTPSGEAK